MSQYRDKFDINEFNNKYRGTNTFTGTSSTNNKMSPYFSLFLESLDDETLLGKIKFANDYLRIPPIQSFIKFHHEIFNQVMLPKEKQALGACFGYLYKEIYGGYQSQTCWVNDQETGIKTASYFIKG